MSVLFVAWVLYSVFVLLCKHSIVFSNFNLEFVGCGVHKHFSAGSAMTLEKIWKRNVQEVSGKGN